MGKEVIRERGVLTPNIQVQPTDMSQSNLTQQLANTANNLATILADKASKKYELDFKNTASEGINDAYMRNQNNPQQLDKELRALRSGLIKNAPYNLRDNFDVAFNDASRPYMNKATDGFNRILSDKLQESSLKSLELNKRALAENMAEIMSNDPARRMDGQKSFQLRIQDMSAVASQVDATGMPIFSASQRIKFMQDAMGSTVFFGVKESYDNAVDKQAFLNKFKNGELKASIFLDEQGNFAEMPIKDGMDIEAYNRTIGYMESDIKSLQLEGLRQEMRQQKLLVEDPAQFSLESGARTLDDRSAIQLKNGVAQGNLRILTNSEAQMKAHDLNGIIDSKSMKEALLKIREETGQHYLSVMNQIKKNGLSDQMTYLATLDLEEYKGQADASFAMAISGKEITERATARTGITTAKIRESVAESINDELSVYAAETPGGDAQIASLLNNMSNVATYYVAQGMDIEAATERAIAPVKDKTKIGYVNDIPFRITPGDDIDEIEDALEYAIDNTSFTKGGALQNSYYKRTVRPTLSTDETKYYLKDELGYIVKDSQGNTIYYPVNDIITKKRKRDEEIRNRQAIESFNIGD